MLLDRPVTPDSRRPQSSCKPTSTHARRGTGPPPNSADTKKTMQQIRRSGGGTPAAARVGPLPRRRKRAGERPAPHHSYAADVTAQPPQGVSVFQSARLEPCASYFQDSSRQSPGRGKSISISYHSFFFCDCYLHDKLKSTRPPPGPHMQQIGRI